MKKVKFAVIGVGGYAKAYLRCLENTGKEGLSRLSAVIIRNEKKYPEEGAELKARNVAIYPDLDTLFSSELAGELDVIAIPTAINFHALMTIKCLEKGYHVLVEKPIAATIQEVDEMIKVKNATRKICAVGYQDIFSDSVQHIKKRIFEGKLGRLKTLKCLAVGARGDEYYHRNTWAGKLKTGQGWILDSPHNNAFAHFLNIMCYWSGSNLNKSAEIESVIAELYRANEIESADTFCLKARTADGIEIFFAGTHCTSVESNIRIIVEAEKGAIHWQPTSLEGENKIIYNSGKEEIVTEGVNCREEMFRNICVVVKSQEQEPLCTLEIGRAHTLCINASFESSDIISISDKYIKRKEREKGGMVTTIKGIDETIKESFENKKMFSELGVNWAKEGQWIDLKSYTHFPSFKKI